MIRKSLRYIIITCCFCILFVSSYTHAASHCSGVDATIGTVTLKGVGSNQITYEITIQNAGTQIIDLSKLTLKNYVSTDDTYDVGDTDGGQAVINTLTSGSQLLAGASVTFTFHANYSVDIKTIPYLILQLAYQDAECDASNNQLVVCTRPNATYDSYYITSISSGEADFNFVLHNRGGDTLFLTALILQSYVSMNNTFDGSDPASGGTVLSGSTGVNYLLADETFASTYGAYQPNIMTYSYVISNLEYSHAECSTSDNQEIQPLVVTSITNATSAESNASIIWDMNSRSFTTKNQGGVVWSGTLNYQLFDLSGRLLTSGKTSPGEQVFLFEGSGLGLLIVSDQQQTYSKKIMR